MYDVRPRFLDILIVQGRMTDIRASTAGDGWILGPKGGVQRNGPSGFWDFTSDLSLKDTAYTSLALGAHTDTTYFSEPAGLQMFHLLSHTEGDGGASLLVDGFRAANILKQGFPDAFKILSTFRISSHASGNDGIHLRPDFDRPVLNLGPPDAFLPEQSVYQVRWNNDDRAVLPVNSAGRQSEISVDAWYDAARKWVDILRRAESEYWEQLRPGRALIFDNWRVLHGRSAFTGKRRICGGYMNHDDFMSRWRTLNMSAEELSLTV
ncbi:hypothetical protein MMC15_003823 [Xylographa vitiligo]|nr:hypothetical protein [Xylographa vitiligo]